MIFTRLDPASAIVQVAKSNRFVKNPDEDVPRLGFQKCPGPDQKIYCSPAERPRAGDGTVKLTNAKKTKTAANQVLRLERREIRHFHVTEHPMAQWTARQIVEAFSWDEAPRYLLRDRDGIYGKQFRRRVRRLGIEELLIAPRSPWQSPNVEQLTGSIRREHLGHAIGFQEHHLKRILNSYISYYHNVRTHLSSSKESPKPQRVVPPGQGKVIAFRHTGGLHQLVDCITSTGALPAYTDCNATPAGTLLGACLLRIVLGPLPRNCFATPHRNRPYFVTAHWSS